MTGDAADLQPVVMSCLDDNPKYHPVATAGQVSVTIKRAKDASSQKSDCDGMACKSQPFEQKTRFFVFAVS